MKREKFSRACVLFLLTVLLVGLGKTLFFPKDRNYYENRLANQIPDFTLSAYLDTSFQEGVENAFLDQVNFASNAKKLYHNVSSFLLYCGLRDVTEQNPDRYVRFLDMWIFGREYLLYYLRPLSQFESGLREKAANYNACFSQHPELDFYLYYVEKDTDINFETGEKNQMFPFLQEQLDLPQSHIACFTVDNFEDFSQRFYKTDHHWNHRGSYLGYEQIAGLLGIPETDLLPVLEEVDLRQSFFGAKASTAGTEVFSDEFFAFRFAFPEMTVTINGEPAEDYGSQEAYFSGMAKEPIGYGNFYGGDYGETILDTQSPEKENLLILGDSYDNAVIKLLASHFGKTCAVDLRYYEHSLGRPFRFSQYVEEHQITKVLFVGGADHYYLPEFLLEG